MQITQAVTPTGTRVTIQGPAGQGGTGETAASQTGGGLVLRQETVSASAGTAGGITVLWPRVIPATDDPTIRNLASALQGRLEKVAQRALPHHTPVEVRPEPERSCPQGGCAGVSVGLVLAHKDGACAAVITVAQAGISPSNLVAWGGRVELKQAQVPFREAPESFLTIKDWARCETLLNELDSALPQQTIATVGQ